MTNADLTDVPGLIRAELIRLRAEREVFTEERSALKAELESTVDEVARLQRDHDTEIRKQLEASQKRLTDADQEIAENASEISALQAEKAVARTERDVLRTELTTIRQERDKLRLLLLDRELEAAGSVKSLPRARVNLKKNTTETTGPEDTTEELHRCIEHLTSELAATHQTLSWRITAPLRAVRRKTVRQKTTRRKTVR
jgi:predicted  nucleic acid-binding Zn-ribbon protein